MTPFWKIGPVGLFLGLTLEYSGIPVPGETLLLLFGALERDTSSLLVVLLAGASGSILGSWLAYRIARKVKRETLLRVVGRLGISPTAWARSEEKIARMRIPLLLFGRYVLGVRIVIPYVMGLERMPEGSFIAYNAISALLWCGPLLAAGRVVGAERSVIALRLHRVGMIILLLLTAGGLLWWLVRRLVRR